MAPPAPAAARRWLRPDRPSRRARRRPPRPSVSLAASSWPSSSAAIVRSVLASPPAASTAARRSRKAPRRSARAAGRSPSRPGCGRPAAAPAPPRPGPASSRAWPYSRPNAAFSAWVSGVAAAVAVLRQAHAPVGPGARAGSTVAALGHVRQQPPPRAPGPGRDGPCPELPRRRRPRRPSHPPAAWLRAAPTPAPARRPAPARGSSLSKPSPGRGGPARRPAPCGGQLRPGAGLHGLGGAGGLAWAAQVKQRLQEDPLGRCGRDGASAGASSRRLAWMPKARRTA